MSEPFRPYEKLVEITLLGKKFQVPERNSLLRCFQFISPETIPYGRFCWNQECQYCRVSCQLPDDDESREMLSCKFIVMAGMEITEISQELKWCLRAKLPSDTPVSSVIPRSVCSRCFRCITLLSSDEREYFRNFVRRLWPARFFGTHCATFATSGMGHSIPANSSSHAVAWGHFATSAGGISVFA